MAEQEGSMPEQEHPILADQELLCYKPNTQVLLLLVDHKKNKIEKPSLIFCNDNDLQVRDWPKPVTIYNGMWHSCRPSKKEYNLLGTKQLSIHNYNILSEGITVHTTEDLANTPDDSEPASQSTSNSEHKQLDLLNQQIHHSLVEPAHLPVIQPS